LGRINTGRVVLGGLVAGVVANALDYVINAYLMAEEGADMAQRLNLSQDVMQSSTYVWVGVDMIWGLLLVFTYAAFRPRFGPGPKTAILSGFTLWFAVCIMFGGLMSMGIFTLPGFIKYSALTLISALAASLAGAAIYQE
jgi:glucan phosphoethanolaminetransferase (alkaline phosphatase superfamily)